VSTVGMLIIFLTYPTMTTLTVPATYENWVIIPSEKIETHKSSKFFVVVHYEEKEEESYSWLDHIYQETKKSGEIFHSHQDFMKSILS
jgi:hypothetical protein